MARKRDLLGLTPHWHVDCRLEHELPEDRIVGRRFLVQVAFGSVALASMLLAGWVGYTRFSLVREISDWEQQIESRRDQTAEIQRNQVDFQKESAKIAQAAAEVGSPVRFSAFIPELGRDLPDSITVDSIDWYGDELVVAGVVPSNAVFRNYLAFLRSENSSLGEIFPDIYQRSYERVRDTEIFEFELGFRPTPAP